MSTHALAASQEILRAICMLNNTPEFRVFVSGLRSRRDQVRDEMEGADTNPIVHAYRGRSGELTDMLEVIDTSQKLLAARMQIGAK